MASGLGDGIRADRGDSMRLNDGVGFDAVCPAYVETDLSREMLAKRATGMTVNVNWNISATR